MNPAGIHEDQQAFVKAAHHAAETGPGAEPCDQASTLFPEIVVGDPNADEEREQAKYHDGLAGRMVKNKKFEYTTIAVIMLNAVEIGWDTDYSARHGSFNLWEKGAPVGFLVAENTFAAYFTFEIFVRFCAYKLKLKCLFDWSFVFDAVLVIFMVIETWALPLFMSGGNSPLGQLSILRLLRLLRITRMAKLMRAFPELMMIIKGITAATKAVVWTAILLVIITYTWAILFTNEYHQGPLKDDDVTEGSAEEFFGSMGKSMLSLLVMGTILDDVTACTTVIRDTENIWMLSAFIIYILINSFTMMNMLVGILVEVVGNTADEEKKRLLEEKVRDSIKSIFIEMDKDKSGMVSRKEFQEMRRHKTVARALNDLQIKEKQFDMYCELLFEKTETGEETSIGFEKLLNMILRLRPGTAVSSLDFAAFAQTVSGATAQMRDRIARLDRSCDVLASEAPLQLSMDTPRGDEKHDSGFPQDASPISHGSTAPLLGTAVMQNRQETERQKQVINVQMLALLERTPSAVIINELQRRLGMASLEETGVPLSMMDEELQQRVRDAEAFQTLCVPHPDPEWSKETMTC